MFECAVSHSDAQVVWYFNNMQVDQMQTRKRFQILSIGEFRRLAIRNCLIHETNTPVKCKWGELETSANLFVTDCPFIFKEGLKNQKVPKGLPAVLECQIINNLAPQEIKLGWKKDGKPIDLDTLKDKYEFTIDGDKYKLTIKDFNKEDEANYEIYLTEPDDFDVSSTAKIELLPSDQEQTIEDVTVSKEETEAEQTLDSIEIQSKPKQPEPEPEPKFVYKLNDCHVRKHQEAVFELKIPAKLITRVQWRRDGKPISSSDLKYRTEQGKLVARLVISDALPDDEARYTAVIDEEEISAMLTVEDFVEILSPLKDQTLFEKEELKLSVTISDKNVPGTWFKDGKPLEQSDNVIIESFNGKHELTIKNSKLDDAGVYTFVANDAKSECKVTVNEEPVKIVKRLQDQDGLENTPVVFECELNKPNVPVEWYFNDLPIHQALSPDAYVITQTDNKYTLTLPKCQMKMQGMFTMEIPKGNLKTKGLLNIEEAQAEFVSQLEDKTVKEDETVEFVCTVTKKDAKVKWSLNGERLAAGENIKMLSDGDKRILKIRNCQLTDSGPVVCSMPGNQTTQAQLTVEEIPIEIETKSVEVFEKEDAKLDALLSRDVSKKDSSWVFKTTVKIGGDSLKYSHDYQRDLQKHTLTIRDCTLADAGEYTFKARSSQATINLIVKELPCKFLRPLSDQNPTEHTNVSFDVALSKPDHTVKWFLNGKELTDGDKFKPKQVDKQRFSLEINDVLVPDEGQLKCVVYNDKGDEVATSECNLTVREIPLDFEKGLSNVRCMEKDEIRFECKLNRDDIKPDQIAWYRDGEKLVDGDEDGRIQFIHDGPRQFLVIKGAKLDDAGNYDIRIKNVKSSANLKVKEEPVVFVRQLKEVYQPVEKETLTLECEVSKDNVRCVWKRYGKEIDQDDRVRVEVDGRVQRLIIENVTMSDKQSLSCVAVRGRNIDDELASTVSRITVKEGPLELVKGLEDEKVKEGQDAILSVTLNKPNEEVEWYKDGVRIRSDPTNRIYSNNNIYYLRINNCDPRQNPGTYTFKVKDLETTGNLDVEEKPIEIISELSDKTCYEKQTVRFEIELNKPELLDRLIWSRNDQEIDLKNDNYDLKAIGCKYVLTIKKALFDDDGQYQVRIAQSELSSTAKLTVNEAPLEFIRPVNEIELKENQTAMFECELNKPGEQVRWYRNGELIEPDGKNIIAKSDGTVHQLILKKVDASDAAKYTCKTSGPSSSGSLYVEEIPVEFIQKLANVRVKEKETATFTCQLNKENAPVKWFRAGLEILPDDKKYKYICDGSRYSLQILDCQMEDMSDYAIVFRGRKSAAELEVEELPADILKPLQNVTVYEKQELVLECEFSRPNVEAVWQKGDLDVKYALGTDRFTKKCDGQVYRLTIYEAKLDDAGSYSCTVKTTKTSCDVKVLERPVEVMKSLEDQEVVEKQKATFVCTLSKPRLKVAWYKGDKKLSENDRIQFVQEGKVYKLVINNSQLDDAGMYKIKFGDEAESTAELFVKGSY